MLKFLIYLGTSRQDNYSQHVAKFVQKVVNKNSEVETELITSKDLKINFSDEGQAANPPELLKKVKQADGFILVVPEYNHGYPGTLKYMLDLNLKAYIHKPVGLVGVSAGPFGGIRAIENLLPILRELGLAVTFEDVNVGGVMQEFKDGKVQNPETWEKRVNKMLEELIWMAKTMKHGRKNF